MIYNLILKLKMFIILFSAGVIVSTLGLLESSRYISKRVRRRSIRRSRRNIK